tara:strand:+ start:769 stop:1005 length:237 start_codon:yes stop_codon:yes gene_type:complete
MKLKIKSRKALYKAVEAAIVSAENLFGPGTGPQKRAWVVESINKAIDIPYIGEGMEEVIIGFLVDMLIEFLNEKGLSE